DRGSTEPACLNSPNPGDLAGAKSVVVAPAVSGGAPELVYVAASTSSSDAVTTFTTDGDPLVSQDSQDECISSENARCRAGEGLEGARDVAASPDGKNLYAVGDSTLVTLDRNYEGGLTSAGCLRGTTSKRTTCATTPTAGLNGAN